MRSPILGLRASSVIFALVCLGHLVRLWARWEVHVGPVEFGPVASIITVVITALLSVWLWSLSAAKGSGQL